MIRVSTRGRYALRAMVDLAEHAGDAPVARQGLAERQGLSADYVAHLFQDLQDAGLVEGVKGPGGGYRLARGAGQIRAGDVVQAVEGPVGVVRCTLPCPDQRTRCRRADDCPTRPLWLRVSAAVTDVLNSVTLRDLCEHRPVPGGLT